MSAARGARLAAVALVLALPVAQASLLPGLPGPVPAGPSQAASHGGVWAWLGDTVGPFLEEPAEGSSCLGGLGPLFCARAASDVALSCVVSATAFTCDVSASHEAAGSTASGADGELLVPSHFEVGVCNGPGPCDVTVAAVAAPCTWASGDHGCSTSGAVSTTVAGPLAGCLFVWVSQDLSAHARLPGIGLDLATDQAGDLEEFSTC